MQKGGYFMYRLCEGVKNGLKKVPASARQTKLRAYLIFKAAPLFCDQIAPGRAWAWCDARSDVRACEPSKKFGTRWRRGLEQGLFQKHTKNNQNLSVPEKSTGMILGGFWYQNKHVKKSGEKGAPRTGYLAYPRQTGVSRVGHPETI